MKVAGVIILAAISIALPIWFLANRDALRPIQQLVVQQNESVSVPPGSLKVSVDGSFGRKADRPRITNVTAIPSSSGEGFDVLYCDAVRNSVGRISKTNDKYEQSWLVPVNSLASPCHAVLADVDGDKDQDVAVAVLGRVWPTDSRVGQVAILECVGNDQFEVKIIADHLRRVTDVQPADLDGDGDIDFVVAEFGYLHGGILFLENQGDGTFAHRRLLDLPGTVHVPVADFDGDGDLDFAAVVSQDHEEIVLFENTGSEKFEPIQHRIWSTVNFDLGMAGMVTDDLDQDGDIDLLLSAGDNLELDFPYPQPWHGCIWLENKDGKSFVEHRIGHLPGTYAAAAGDLDGDGDRDIVLASMFNDWKQPGATSLAWLENDGQQNFQVGHLASTPTHLCTAAAADMDGDGKIEIIGGSLQIYPPYQNKPAGVTIWSIGDAP